MKNTYKKGNPTLIFTLAFIVPFVALVVIYFFTNRRPVELSTALMVVVLLMAIAIFWRNEKIIDRHRDIHEGGVKLVEHEYHQLETLVSLYTILNPRLPLPQTRYWAASPDVLEKLATLVLTKKPRCVVEAGSGISTLVTAYCLQKLGRGKVISFDHDPHYAGRNQKRLVDHGLEAFVEIIVAPVKEVEIEGETWKWYDHTKININQPIDLLFVDGPPRRTQKLARYPAVPLLKKHFSEDITILLDDGDRVEETTTAEMWANELNMKAEHVATEKGAYILEIG
ncbi:MAG: class I SAM-dependent methyltransferase [Bacteroidetes bacterium]|jgi:predicted O-methyltransferase YrrM|nr:class I SAM-dependent methyltransferase [Bacteroidota bacterium]